LAGKGPVKRLVRLPEDLVLFIDRPLMSVGPDSSRRWSKNSEAAGIVAALLTSSFLMKRETLLPSYCSIQIRDSAIILQPGVHADPRKRTCMDAGAKFSATSDYFRSARAVSGELYRMGAGPFARHFRQTPSSNRS
jgi:hypothetical protein